MPANHQGLDGEEQQNSVLTVPAQTATQALTLHPGLPLTTAPQSPSTGLRSSPDVIAVASELEMLMSASRMSFRPLQARCFLAEPSLAILLDLALMGNISSSQVKLKL